MNPNIQNLPRDRSLAEAIARALGVPYGALKTDLLTPIPGKEAPRGGDSTDHEGPRAEPGVFDPDRIFDDLKAHYAESIGSLAYLEHGMFERLEASGEAVKEGEADLIAAMDALQTCSNQQRERMKRFMLDRNLLHAAISARTGHTDFFIDDKTREVFIPKKEVK